MSYIRIRREGSFLYEYISTAEYEERKSRLLGFEVLQHRLFQEDKLKMPAQGLKRITSVPYTNRVKCSIYHKDLSLYVKHGDYFSPSFRAKEIGTPLEFRMEKYFNQTRRKKFVYGDAWGDIVLRSEAWVKLHNLLYVLQYMRYNNVADDIIRLQEQYHEMSEGCLVCSDMGRFWENVCKEVLSVI